MNPSLAIEPDWKLLEKRLEKKFEKGKLSTIYSVKGKITPEQQLDEIKNKTPDGYRFMLAEHGLLEYLLAYE